MNIGNESGKMLVLVMEIEFCGDFIVRRVVVWYVDFVIGGDDGGYELFGGYDKWTL